MPHDPLPSHARRRTARALGAVVVGGLALAGCTAAGDAPDATGVPEQTTPAPVPEPAGPGTGVQLFQWTWASIGRECGEFLGPAGYDWVLTSPPQEHVLGEPWWTAYQPVSYRLESRLGTRDEFAAMVAACDEAGVAVVADAVINHMTGQDEPGVGWAGSPYEHYEYPGLYSDAEGDFHHCGLAAGDDIAQYRSAGQVQQCELVNLADLATGTDRVRERIGAYLADLVSLGVAGFRIDAAKHMPAEDVGAVLAGLPEDVWAFQEVIGATEEPIRPEDYLPNGLVTDFFYGRELAALVGGGSLDRVLEYPQSSTALPSEQAVVFVENHDTERNGSTLSYKDDADYLQAVVMLLAADYGTPVVYSGYAFRTRDAGPVQDPDGAVQDVRCAAAPPAWGEAPQDPPGTWLCQHRWTPVAGLVGWRAEVGAAPVTDLWVGRRAVAFGRGDRGFVVVNGNAAAMAETLTTSLPPGTYCDVVSGALVDGACTGEELTVADDGTVEVALDGDSALALHAGARADG
ncbi:glycosidase [Actinotalea ferrariae CF5-4]|uniref:Alpha-amylase n=1 Tax=Actinotalea ferrariae CF5-4 TaxID=948458 RepID=A0A021VRH4_9CELL|nr:alpha-amylase family protein [Actinotalea ferrariae]EYR63736.1 glycosidase [Actinotalea ferrariae CF5-4]